MSEGNAQLFYARLEDNEKRLVHAMVTTEESLKLPIIQKLAAEMGVGRRMVSILLDTMQEHKLLQKKPNPDRVPGRMASGPQHVYEFDMTTVCTIVELLAEKIESLREPEPSDKEPEPTDEELAMNDQLLRRMFNSE